MKVIVINSGSSSIKYATFDISGCAPVARGILEKIGSSESRLKHQRIRNGIWEEMTETQAVADHRRGFAFILEATANVRVIRDMSDLFGFGHRVVHGGEVFHEPAIIDDKVVSAIDNLIPLAPLHNPANLLGIKVLRDLCPQIPQVAVFDTSFHQSMPPYAFHYALPHELYEKYDVRRYGFHGSSHQYVAKEASKHLRIPLEHLNMITLHLGNGASATAIKNGKSIDTSMGLTPLEGLMMGTRCGDLDPAIHFYISRKTGKSYEDIENMLNRESGLKGICGINDMREIQRCAEQGDSRAVLAIEMFCYRIKKYIGAYCAVLGRVDAVVFTGGIGENSAHVRNAACDGLSVFGISIDERKNNSHVGGIKEIQRDDSRVRILLIPTDEELEIARHTIHTILRAKEEFNPLPVKEHLQKPGPGKGN